MAGRRLSDGHFLVGLRSTRGGTPPEDSPRGLPERTPPEDSPRGLPQGSPPGGSPRGLPRRTPPEDSPRGLPQRTPQEDSPGGLPRRTPRTPEGSPPEPGPYSPQKEGVFPVTATLQGSRNYMRCRATYVISGPKKRSKLPPGNPRNQGRMFPKTGTTISTFFLTNVFL